ncbi:hypothetical protein CXF83_15060 [Shewanella sp. Choline-02u-19]|uniref:hypothetical protein n=1 Tax=unclassified Shewanella TaxID=196818 RepID=UPI000C342EAE|nr:MULTISPECIES: hypothetical protein [unclassified Shewanella]PKH62186.1 hypothetical protein CXF84_01360 [Shewanella sp. Bg11-22]PKI27937.1 hypothetical protein CXF83_15060 [Shewanella sp. Choline-02u-19]
MKTNKLTQKERLQRIITGTRFWSLFEIQEECLTRFKTHDSETALSARWRELPIAARVKRLREGTRSTYEYRLAG